VGHVIDFFQSHADGSELDPVTARMCRQGARILKNLRSTERYRWEASRASSSSSLSREDSLGSLGDVIRHAGELGATPAEGRTPTDTNAVATSTMSIATSLTASLETATTADSEAATNGGPFPPPGSFDLGAGADSGTTYVLRSLGLLEDQMSVDGYLDPAAMASLNAGMMPASLSTDDLVGVGTDLGASWATGIW
jgi:hypothetical protein